MYSLDWPFAHGQPRSTALFKQSPEDFEVHELSSAEFSGSGEHIMLKIEKRGLNTEEVIKSMARLINKRVNSISYAGLKDRQALSTQWLSIHAPGEEIADVGSLAGNGWRVLEHHRHNKKLRPGFLQGNQFHIRLNEVTELDDLIARIDLIKTQGVPNYFGEQRFGRQAGNLLKAESLLVEGKKVKDRFLKGMYYSAARSWLFNLILAKRVAQGSWNRPLHGDVMQLAGSHSLFKSDGDTVNLQQRIENKDISPASPLAGKTKSMVTGAALELINEVYQAWPEWVSGLEQQGLEEAWRANILYPEQLEYRIRGDSVELSFALPAGAYATVVLRELTKS